MRATSRVLVVEDDEDDFFFTQRALRHFTSGSIFHVEGGRAAIDYLAGRGAYADRAQFPLPDLVFLDLKMDQVSGHDVLRWVREQMPEGRPRIYILTGSNEPRDREAVQASGVAAGYVVKPLTDAHLRPIFERGAEP